MVGVMEVDRATIRNDYTAESHHSIQSNEYAR